MDELIYEIKHKLFMRDCDTFQRIKPSAVLCMFQDCSEALTEGWGVGLGEMLSRDAIWVAAKVEAQATRLPLHAEEVTVRGWAKRSRSGIFPFHYEMLDTEGNELISGCSMWVLSSLKTHSMMSPDVPKITLPTPEPDNAPLPRMRPIKGPEEKRRDTRRVRFTETDINGHLTNTRYMDWVCDLPDREFHRTHPWKALRIDYRAEIYPDEDVVLDWACSDDGLWCESPGKFTAAIYYK